VTNVLEVEVARGMRYSSNTTNLVADFLFWNLAFFKSLRVKMEK